jgi:hypothetical protein
MKLQFTKNVAINTEASDNTKLAGFYKSLGLETKQQREAAFMVLRSRWQFDK